MNNSVLKKCHIFTLLIFISSLFLSIGYARIDGVDLVMTGTASVKPLGLYIKSVTYYSNNNADLNNCLINSYDNTVLNSSIKLGNSLDSFITYQIIISNNTTDSVYFMNAIYDHSNSSFYSNNDIVYNVSGIATGDEIVSNGSKTFTITFKYIDGLTNISNTILDSYINFKFSNEKYTYYSNYETFDGTKCINTHTSMFTAVNIGKDFELGFTIDNYNYSQNMVLVNSRYLTGNNPGFAISYFNKNRIQLAGTAGNQNYQVSSTNSFVARREGSDLYVGTNGASPTRIGSLGTNNFNTAITFGCSLSSTDVEQYFFKGTLSEIYLKVNEN